MTLPEVGITPAPTQEVPAPARTVQKTAPPPPAQTAPAPAYDEPVIEPVTEPVVGEPVANVDVFYDQLEPYGTWFDDPFGWATSHYGRWVYANRWVWVPDTTWGPAWVTWRQGDDYIGWAPCGYGANAYVPDQYWRFVAPTVLFSVDVHRYYVVRDHRRYLDHSVPIARYHRHDNAYWPAGPSDDGMRRNDVAVARARPDPINIGRFDRQRRLDLERQAQARASEWAPRRTRVQQVRPVIEQRVQVQRQDEQRLVDVQRRMFDEQRAQAAQAQRLDEQRRQI